MGIQKKKTIQATNPKHCQMAALQTKTPGVPAKALPREPSEAETPIIHSNTTEPTESTSTTTWNTADKTTKRAGTKVHSK